MTRIAIGGGADAALIVAAPETAIERDRLKEINAEMLHALEYLLEEVCKKDGNPFDGATDTAAAAIRKHKGVAS